MAEVCLQAHIAAKRDPAKLPQRGADRAYLADVLSVYLDEVVRKGQGEIAIEESTPGLRRAEARIERLAAWWGQKTVAAVNEASCKAYLESRQRAHADASTGTSNGKARTNQALPGKGGGRRDLEDLVEHVYGHHDPNFQQRAAGAFGSKSRYESGSGTVAKQRNRT